MRRYLIALASFMLMTSAAQANVCEYNNGPCPQIYISKGKHIILFHDVSYGNILYSCGPLSESIQADLKAVVILSPGSSIIFTTSERPTILNCSEY